MIFPTQSLMFERSIQTENDSAKLGNKRSIYEKIDDATRRELIENSLKGKSLKQAAAELGINYSTAKTINQTFKREKRIKKKSKRALQTKKGIKKEMNMRRILIKSRVSRLMENMINEDKKILCSKLSDDIKDTKDKNDMQSTLQSTQQRHEDADEAEDINAFKSNLRYYRSALDLVKAAQEEDMDLFPIQEEGLEPSQECQEEKPSKHETVFPNCVNTSSKIKTDDPPGQDEEGPLVGQYSRAVLAELKSVCFQHQKSLFVVHQEENYGINFQNMKNLLKSHPQKRVGQELLPKLPCINTMIQNTMKEEPKLRHFFTEEIEIPTFFFSHNFPKNNYVPSELFQVKNPGLLKTLTLPIPFVHKY